MTKAGIPGSRVENRVTPHSDAGSRKENLTSKLAGILGSRVGARDDRVGASGARDDSAGPPGDWGGHKKEPEGCLLLTSFRLIF